jgi:signal peptidase I
MMPHPDEPTVARDRLERNGMAWPPSSWERQPAAWRDDIWAGPEAFLPYDATLTGPEPRAERAPRLGSGNLAREVLETVVLTLLIFLGIRMVVQNFRIEGRSMEPTLHDGQFLLVNKLAYRGFGEPQRGDVVVFEAWQQEKDFIKRVVGLPGDEIAIHDQLVYVNGSPLDEPYLDQDTVDTIGSITLGDGQYYVLGDNRGNSSDSRTYGPLPSEQIIGKAWLTYWPPGQMGFVPDRQRSYASGP